jgi:hypothetical protein
MQRGERWQSAERRPCGNTTRSVVHGYHWVSNWSNWDCQIHEGHPLGSPSIPHPSSSFKVIQTGLKVILCAQKWHMEFQNYMTVTWRLHGLTGLIRGETTYVSPPTHQPTNNHQPLYKYHQTQRFVFELDQTNT